MAYLIVFGILIIGVLVWQARQSKQLIFDLSKQIFPELNLIVLSTKKDRKINEVIIRTEAKKEIVLKEIKFELISPQREFIYILSAELIDPSSFPHQLTKGESIDMTFQYEELKRIIKEKMPLMHSFRAVLELENGKVFKSHELTISKYWKIHKADTGRYN